MTDRDDDLMQQLAAANPIDPRSIPAATDPAAQQLLENTMSNTPFQDTNPAPTTGPSEPVTMIDANGDRYITSAAAAAGQAADQRHNDVGDDVRDGIRQIAPAARRSARRGRGMLVGAAAAVLLLVGGLLVFSPDNTPSAVATVHSAAAAAADADTGRIATTFALTADGDAALEQVDGRFDVSYAGSDVAFTLDVEDQTGDIGLDELPVNEARLVDDILYVNDDGQWLAVDTEGFLGQVVADFIDPRVVLETVQELTEAVEVGTATIDGEETTHYQSVVDLGDESLSQSGWLAFEGVPIEAEGEVTVDLYVGSDGVLSQLDLAGDVQDNTDGESGTFDVSMNFFDIGTDITVEAPADAELLDPLQGFLGGQDLDE